MTKQKLMICPKAKECPNKAKHIEIWGEKASCKPHKYHFSCDSHYCTEGIDSDNVGACIPVEPEPTCLHTWSWAEGQTHEVCSKCGEKGEQVVDNAKQEIAAILRKYDCLMIPVEDKQLKEQLLAVLRTPADLQPEKHEGSARWWDEAPQMPLIAVIASYYCKDYTEKKCVGCAMKRPTCESIIDEIHTGVQSWLPAHDQQVRKAFAEECIKTIEAPQCFRDTTGTPVPNASFAGAMLFYEYVIAHIRAMAGE